MTTRALIFTLGETLYPTSDFRNELFRHLAREMAERYQQDVEGLYWALHEHVGSDIEVDPRQFLTEVIEQEKLCSSPGQRAADIEDLYRVVSEFEPTDLKLYSSARKLLQYLRGDMPLGLIAYGHGVLQRNKIRALGLVDVFDFIACASDHGTIWERPSPLPHLAVCEHFGVRATDALAVSCQSRIDFAAPRALGMSCARVGRRGRPQDSVGEVLIEVDTLLELAEQPVIAASRAANSTRRRRIEAKPSIPYWN